MSTALTLSIGAIIGASVGRATGEINSRLDTLRANISKIGNEKLKIEGMISSKKNTNELNTDVTLLTKKLKTLNTEFISVNKSITSYNKIVSHKSKIDSNILDLTKLTAVAYGFSNIISSAQEVSKAQGEIASLGIGTDGIDAITKSARNFTNQFAGVTTPEFIRASYDIKSGISSLSDEGVAEFTRLSALTAKATKSTVAEMTKTFALGYGVFRKQFTSDEEFGSAFSTAVSSAVQGFRTDGADLSGSISALGAMAVSKGVSLSEQFATIGMLKNTFASASEAATGFKAFLGGVGKAQEKLGLTFTDSSGKMLPVVDILELIKGKYGDLEDVATQDLLKKAFGSDEAVKMIMGTVHETEALRQAQLKLESDIKAGTLTEEMAKAMSAGEAFQLLGNQLRNLGEIVGKTLVPSLTYVSSVIGKFVVWLSNAGEKFPFLSAGVGTLLVSLTGLVIVVKVASILISSFMVAVYSVRIVIEATRRALMLKNIVLLATNIRLKAVTLATTLYGKVSKVAMAGVRLFTVAMRSLNLAMFANPIGLVIAGVVALAGGAYMLIKHWDKVKAFFSGLWEFLKGLFSRIGEFYANTFGAIIDGMKASIGWVSDKVTSISKAIGGLFGGGDDSVNVNATTSTTTSPIDTIANSSSINNNNAGITYSPQIIINGNADKATIATALDEDKARFKKMYDSMSMNNNRLAFSGA